VVEHRHRAHAGRPPLGQPGTCPHQRTIGVTQTVEGERMPLVPHRDRRHPPRDLCVDGGPGRVQPTPVNRGGKVVDQSKERNALLVADIDMVHARHPRSADRQARRLGAPENESSFLFRRAESLYRHRVHAAGSN
jgi:hypothetical protein